MFGGKIFKHGKGGHKSCWDCEHAQIAGFPMSRCSKRPNVGRLSWENDSSTADQCQHYELCTELSNLVFSDPSRVCGW